MPHKKLQKTRQQNIEIFLGTSIVPKGRMKYDQVNKQAQAITNYIEKKRKHKLQGIDSGEIRLTPVELRLEFIPFQKNEKFGKEAFDEAFAKHQAKVEKKAIKIFNEFVKKNTGFKDDRWQLHLELVDSYKKTSITHKLNP